MASSAGSAQPKRSTSILRDGGTLRLRPPDADDADALVAFFARLSQREPLSALPRRAAASTRALVEPFLDPDWVERGALVGTLADERRRADRRARELRAPARPGGGRGRVRRRRRASRAAGSARACSSSSRRARRRAGIERFVAEVLPGNRAMLRVFADAGFELDARARAAARSSCAFPIAPTERFRARVEERDHVGGRRVARARSSRRRRSP